MNQWIRAIGITIALFGVTAGIMFTTVFFASHGNCGIVAFVVLFFIACVLLVKWLLGNSR